MADVIDVIATLLAAVVAGLALAHALERPGKTRLSRSEYAVVQRIYYPGFTVAGAVSEVPGVVVTAVAVALADGTVDVALRVVALTALVGVQVVFWAVVQPVNRFWVEGVDLGELGTRFFGRRRGAPGRAADWTALRDRWEGGHVIRAVLACLALVCLVVGLL